jgi:hypothetical protein
MISALLLTLFFAMPSAAAWATGSSCQQEPNGPLQTCELINGSGLHINFDQGSVLNEGNSDQAGVHIQLTWPSGATIKNCGMVTVAPGQTITCTWSPNANEPAGSYCATSWQLVSGRQLERGHACVGVHA